LNFAEAENHGSAVAINIFSRGRGRISIKHVVLGPFVTKQPSHYYDKVCFGYDIPMQTKKNNSVFIYNWIVGKKVAYNVCQASEYLKASC